MPIELQIMANSYKLAFSELEAEKAEALESLSHLINVLRNSDIHTNRPKGLIKGKQ